MFAIYFDVVHSEDLIYKPPDALPHLQTIRAETSTLKSDLSLLVLEASDMAKLSVRFIDAH